MIKIAYNAVPHDRFVLITDSLMAAGLGDGEYELAGQPVRVENGIARTGRRSHCGKHARPLYGGEEPLRFCWNTV